MQTATLDLTLSRAAHDLRIAGRYILLPDWLMRGVTAVAAALVANKLRRLAETLSGDVLRVINLTRMVESRGALDAEMIDAEGSHAAYFANMLDSTKRLHAKGCDLTLFAAKTRSNKLESVSRQFTAMCAEYYEAIAGLAWAIAEHDADRATRKPGYVAATPEDISAMLDRIAAGE